MKRDAGGLTVEAVLAALGFDEKCGLILHEGYKVFAGNLYPFKSGSQPEPQVRELVTTTNLDPFRSNASALLK